jgi:hypothetical protein
MQWILRVPDDLRRAFIIYFLNHFSEVFLKTRKIVGRIFRGGRQANKHGPDKLIVPATMLADDGIALINDVRFRR